MLDIGLLVGFWLVWFGIYLVCFALGCVLDCLGWIEFDLMFCWTVIFYLIFILLDVLGYFG